MDYFAIPIYVISYNRLEEIKLCINKLKEDGYTNITVIDNASTDDELILYLKEVDVEVCFLEKNWGHMVFWSCGLFDEIIENQYYIVTDPDIIAIEQCPNNYVEFFYNVLKEYPEITKVGFSLKIDDLPIEYSNRMDVVRWESFFYDKIISYNPLLYDAEIDTTFALYRPGKIKLFNSAIRTGYPYEARHLGWYLSTDNLSEKQKKYLYMGSVYGNTYSEQKNVKKLKETTLRKMYNELVDIDSKQKIYQTFSKRYSNIYIYGAGVVGKEVGNLLENIEINYNGYIVTNKNEYGCIECNKHRVYSFEEFYGLYCETNTGIIIAVAAGARMDIMQMLYQQGIFNICAIDL